MLRKIIEITSPGTRLSVRNAQLRVRRLDAEEITVPIEDIGVLIVDDSRAVHTQAVFLDILSVGGTVMITDRSHLPAGLMLPIQGHHQQTERHHAQIRLSLPRKKRLWQTLVRAKIILQGELLEQVSGSDGGLARFAGRVRSGDPDNFEAQAAQRYWPRLFGAAFRRNRDKPGTNALLNYGYAVMRAAIARALVASGMLPGLGIFHRNRRNPFCLADDLLEPYRPLVDWRVRRIVDDSEKHHLSLEVREHRAALLSLFNESIYCGDVKLPILVAIECSARSLAESLVDKSRAPDLPCSLPLNLSSLPDEA